MKIEKMVGCTYTNFVVDGVEIADMTKERQQITLIRIMNLLFKDAHFSNNARDIMETLCYYIDATKSEYDDEPCETCGTNYEYLAWEV